VKYELEFAYNVWKKFGLGKPVWNRVRISPPEPCESQDVKERNPVPRGITGPPC
jgi:hypothetical protein